MKIQPRVSFHGLPRSDEVEELCHEEIGKLERYHDRITSCRVVIGEPHHRHHKGNLFSVHIRLGLPGGEVDVNREPPAHHAHEDIHVALRDAFDAVRRRLQDFVRCQEGRTKQHDGRPQTGRGRPAADHRPRPGTPAPAARRRRRRTGPG